MEVIFFYVFLHVELFKKKTASIVVLDVVETKKEWWCALTCE